jgi:hypothetical protein
MKIEYWLVDDEAAIFEHDGDTPPAIGTKVFLKEIFFVDDVVHYPAHKAIRVYLKDEPPRKAKVAEAKENNVNLRDIKQAKDDSAKALKEAGRVKRELGSLRTYLKSTQESKK